MPATRMIKRTSCYSMEEFAEKHGFSLKVAEIVLLANSKSKQQADIGAELFKRAMTERRQRLTDALARELLSSVMSSNA